MPAPILAGRSEEKLKALARQAGNAIGAEPLPITTDLEKTALVRAGFFVSSEAVGREAAIEDARSAIADANAIGAEQVVLVVGAAPGPAP